MDFAAIVSAGVPVLCIDTCSLLDILRDPTRDDARPHDHQAALNLVALAEAGRFIGLMADQVGLEFAVHQSSIQREAERKLQNLLAQVAKLDQLSAVYGAPGTIDLLHVTDHVSRTRAAADRWLARLTRIMPGPNVPARAFARMNAGIAPAAKGRESSKDCLIYETYLEAASILRGAGLTTPIVFLSSNTNDYCTERRVLKPDIVTEFAAMELQYAPNMSAAKFHLGF